MKPITKIEAMTAILKELTRKDLECITSILMKVPAYLIEASVASKFRSFGIKILLDKTIPFDLLAVCLINTPIATRMTTEEATVYIAAVKEFRAATV